MLKFKFWNNISVDLQVRHFLDVEAIVAVEDEEELDEEEDDLGKSCMPLIHSGLYIFYRRALGR